MDVLQVWELSIPGHPLPSCPLSKKLVHPRAPLHCLSSRGLGDGQGFLVMSLVMLARQVVPILVVVAWHTQPVPFGRAREKV